MNLNKLNTPKSSFYSCEKDAENIINRLFVTYPKLGEELKRLLVVNAKDALDNPNQKYSEMIKEITVKDIIEGNYFSLTPKVKLKEHEEEKSYVILAFDNFSPTNNPEYRDCSISFDILCPTDHWDLGNYRVRPLKIAGIIDGILNNSKLSGIGTLNFISLEELIINNDLAGYTLMYRAVHGNDDNLPDGDYLC